MTTQTILVLLALIFFGSAADVPLMFLAVQGSLSIKFIFIAGTSIDILSDILWYIVGRKISIERFFRLRPFRQKPERVQHISRALDKYGSVILFTSKMTFGVGTLVQIIAGANRHNIKKFLAVNTLATIVWFSLLYGLSKTLGSVVLIKSVLKDVKIAFGLFIIIILSFNFFLKKWSERYLK